MDQIKHVSFDGSLKHACYLMDQPKPMCNLMDQLKHVCHDGSTKTCVSVDGSEKLKHVSIDRSTKTCVSFDGLGKLNHMCQSMVHLNYVCHLMDPRRLVCYDQRLWDWGGESNGNSDPSGTPNLGSPRGPRFKKRHQSGSRERERELYRIRSTY